MENRKIAGMRNCLGWCNKQFYSTDKAGITFCDKCRVEKNHRSKTLSRTEMRAMINGPIAKDTPSEK